MFRLAKILDSSNVTENAVELRIKTNGSIVPGSAVSCSNNVLYNTAADSAPDYILARYSNTNDAKICYTVTNDMIFKVEFNAVVSPKLGMKVGLSKSMSDADCVTYNSNGKGIIVGIENQNMVYVRFQKS